MNLRNFVVAFWIVCVAPAVLADTIAKPNIYVNGEVIDADDLNANEDALYNLVNGNLDTNNFDASAGILWTQISTGGQILNVDVNASADIVYTKMKQTDLGVIDADLVDDFSEDDTEHLSSTVPGTSETIGTKPTNLEEEIGDLRGVVKRLAVGTNASYTAASGGNFAGSNWIDGPQRPGSLVYNGGFDAIDTLATGADGDGWVRVLTPTTLAALGLTEVDGQGDGQGINIIDTSDALAGIKQTLDGVKAGTRYQMIAAVKDLVGQCRITTTGADTEQLVVTSDDGGTFQVLSGTFETDATPANIVINLLGVAANASCLWDHVAVYEINPDPMPRSGGVTVTFETEANTDALSTGARAAVGSVAISVVPPGPNHLITVDGLISIQSTNVTETICDIDENGSQKSISNFGWTVSNNVKQYTYSFHYVNIAPTPGTTYTYKIFCQALAGTPVADGGVAPMELYVRMEPAGQ